MTRHGCLCLLLMSAASLATAGTAAVAAPGLPGRTTLRVDGSVLKVSRSTAALTAVQPRENTGEAEGGPSRLRAKARTDLFAAKSWYVPPPPPPPSPPPRPVAPPLPFAYSGAQRDGEVITLFLSMGGRIVIARPGDVFNGSYRFEHVADHAAVFTYLPLNEQQHLPIGNFN